MDKNQLIKYRDSIIYQIYPLSFADGNGDGKGDLRGITDKLDYIKSLSVDYIWITPCFPSPMVDNGYDVSDYCDINPIFGSMSDMEELILKAEKKGIGIILDLVANHTSDKHEWFLKSRQKVEPYVDYYYWADKPLNDWQGAFQGQSAWIYDEVRGQYYLASFAPEQPDLNWNNPLVRKSIANVVDFWIDKGVKGFRCDVLDMISKRLDLPYGNGNGPHLHEYIKGLFGRDNCKDIFTVGECWSSDISNIKLFCGIDRKELSCSFQNDHRSFGVDGDFLPIPYNLKDVANALIKWQKASISGDILYTLFWENHDSPRIVSRFGDENKRYESATMLSTMLNLLCGVVFLYEGQELGITNTDFCTIDDFDDVDAKNTYKKHLARLGEQKLFTRLNFYGRDNARRMIPWDIPRKSWIKHDERQFAWSVEKQEKEDNSVLKYFRKLLKLRKSAKAFSQGDFNLLRLDDNAFVYERVYLDERYTVVCNFTGESEITAQGEVVLSNLGRTSASGKYAPYECAVIKR